MKLTEKEASGLVSPGLKADQERSPRWMAEQQINVLEPRVMLDQGLGSAQPCIIQATRR